MNTLVKECDLLSRVIRNHIIVMTQNDDTLILVKLQGKLEVNCSIHT